MTETRVASNSKSSKDPEQDATNARRAGVAFWILPSAPAGAPFSLDRILYSHEHKIYGKSRTSDTAHTHRIHHTR